MVEEYILVSPFELVLFIVLFTSIILIYRVIFGPTTPDRIVGFNTISTKITVVIAILAFLKNEHVLIDLAIVLLMVNALGSLILAKHFERGDTR